MIQPLRIAHRRIVAGLTVVVPAVFLAALAARHPSPPLSESLPAGGASAGIIPRELSSFERILEPDLLVYWARALPPGAALPPDARLVGALRGTHALDVSKFPGGVFLAYSLPLGRVVAHVTPPTK